MRRLLLIALASWLAGACTSEAKLGSWSKRDSAPLSADDGAMHDLLQPDVPRGGASGLDPLLTDAGLPDNGPDESADVGVRVRSPLCLRNPSLDGIPFAGTLAPDT